MSLLYFYNLFQWDSRNAISQKDRKPVSQSNPLSVRDSITLWHQPHQLLVQPLHSSNNAEAFPGHSTARPYCSFVFRWNSVFSAHQYSNASTTPWPSSSMSTISIGSPSPRSSHSFAPKQSFLFLGQHTGPSTFPPNFTISSPHNSSTHISLHCRYVSSSAATCLEHCSQNHAVSTQSQIAGSSNSAAR